MMLWLKLPKLGNVNPNLPISGLLFFISNDQMLIYWGRVTHVCVSKLTIVGSDNGLLPGRRQAIIWTNAGLFVNSNLRNKLQWNIKQNSDIFIQENAFENVVCEMAAILSQPQCVKVGRCVQGIISHTGNMNLLCSCILQRWMPFSVDCPFVRLMAECVVHLWIPITKGQYVKLC